MQTREDDRRTIETATALAHTYMTRAEAAVLVVEQLLARADDLMHIAQRAQQRLGGAAAAEEAELCQVREIVTGRHRR